MFKDSLYAMHVTGEKQYELTDHLGDVLATIADARANRTDSVIPPLEPPCCIDILNEDSPAVVTSYKAYLQSANDYYPFGELMPGRYFSDTNMITFSSTITEPVNRWLENPWVHFNTGCMPCGIDTMNASRLTFTSSNVTVTDTFRHFLSPYPLTDTPLYGCFGMRYTLRGLRASDSGKVTIVFSNINIPDSSILTAIVYNVTGTYNHAAQVIVPLGPSAVASIDFNSWTDTAVLAIAWTHLYDTADMPYPFSFTIDSLQVDYDTMEAIPVASIVSSEDRYHFGYNGKLKDNDWAGIGNHLDYGARTYDPRIARWINVEPLAEEYPMLSSYAFVGNSPILLNDYDGFEPVKKQAGTSKNFIHLLNISHHKVGLLTGQKAAKYLVSAGETEFEIFQMRPIPKDNYYNKLTARYVYTTKGGWIDMAHFMFYAGRAYGYKLVIVKK